MPLSKSFEKYLKQIVKEAVTSAQRTPNDGNKPPESNGAGLPLGGEAQFWKIEETPEKEDDEDLYRSTFDDMAGTHIDELTEGLNDQLDNLLLFAALFSGINSAFIVFSLPNLNDPFQGLDRLIDVLIGSGNNATAIQLSQKILASESSSTTLNVAVNVLFASSLICSLITAFFAVVGKQWLSYLAEEPGDSDEKTRRTKMQNKVIGIQRYRLRALLDAYLTTTIQIALSLFMLGLILFLYTFSGIVTFFVIGFAGAGLLAYIISAGLALHDPTCPFQTPVTRTLLPGLFSICFDSMYSLWALIHWALITHLKKPTSGPNKQEDHSTIHQAEWNDSLGSDDAFEIKWDSRYALRRKLAAKLQFKPKEGQTIDIEAACWMIQTAEDELAARVGALMLLNVTEREGLHFVATYEETTRRLRDVISVTDEVLKQQANLSAGIKEREWKKLCFYVQVLSHIFGGQTVMDSAQCQVMDWIYQYQKNRNRNKSDHAYTCVPARMVGVMKLLLYSYGNHYSMKHERERLLRFRLYQAPFESDCSTEALSLAAFAMKTLPQVALTGGDQMDNDQLRDDLWHSYVTNDPDILLSNCVGAIVTYAELIEPDTTSTSSSSEAARDLLPSARQLQKLWECIAKTKKDAKGQLPTGKARAEGIDPVQPQPLEEGRTTDCNVFTQGKAEYAASLAEACFKLAKMCSNSPRVFAAYQKNDEFWENAGSQDIEAAKKIVYDIWTVCYEDAQLYANGEPLFSPAETVHHLITVTALLRVADPKLADLKLAIPRGKSITSAQRKALEDAGLKWIKTLVATLKAEDLARNLLFTSPKARGAISYFLQRLAGSDSQGSATERNFAQHYFSLCQEKGHGESQSMKGLAEAMTNWKNSPQKPSSGWTRWLAFNPKP